VDTNDAVKKRPFKPLIHERHERTGSCCREVRAVSSVVQKAGLLWEPFAFLTRLGEAYGSALFAALDFATFAAFCRCRVCSLFTSLLVLGAYLRFVFL
jgi:hypothetical protein